MSKRRLPYILIICALLGFCSLTCDATEGVVTPEPPEPEPYDPTRPTIDSFIAQRDGTTIEDTIVYSGEDIDLIVQATSQAFPVSCGLTEDEVVSGNLLYYFSVVPPTDVPLEGFISQATPPSYEVIWRVPTLIEYDTGQGLLYNLNVRVYDECLANQSNGSLTLRVLSSHGPPAISDTVIQTAIDTSSPVTEIQDQNGFYEVEKSDTCRISITALNRTSSEICDNFGVTEGDELKYEWMSSTGVINLAHHYDPHEATSVEFDIPVTIAVNDGFKIDCRITDECTGTETTAEFNFYIVGPPRVISITGTANGVPLNFDPYFDTYEVLHGDEIILTAVGQVIDGPLCNLKGIVPDMEWTWDEINNANPSIDPEFDPIPVPNDESTIEYVIPAALNGTEYTFQCLLTDRCSGLTDVDNADFLVIVPPDVELTSVQRDSTVVDLSPESGRYEVYPGDLLRIRITGTAKSDTGFCEARGVSLSPPLEYSWENPWNFIVFNYESFPGESYSDLVLVIPEYAPQLTVDLTCTVRDICNELSSQVNVPFKVLESPEE